MRSIRIDPACVRTHLRTGHDRGVGPMVPELAFGPVAEQHWNEQIMRDPLADPRFRIWRHDVPAVVLGRAQRSLGARRGRGRGRDLPVVDRLAGGGAVLVGPWLLDLSVALPISHPFVAGRSIAASYDWIADLFVSVLAGEGVEARTAGIADAGRAPPELTWACFAGISVGEVLVRGRKLVGFAQRRNRHGVLIVAGLLLDTVPWPLLCEAVLETQAPDVIADQARSLACLTINLAQAGDFGGPAGCKQTRVGRIVGALEAGLAVRLGADRADVGMYA